MWTSGVLTKRTTLYRCHQHSGCSPCRRCQHCNASSSHGLDLRQLVLLFASAASFAPGPLRLLHCELEPLNKSNPSMFTGAQAQQLISDAVKIGELHIDLRDNVTAETLPVFYRIMCESKNCVAFSGSGISQHGAFDAWL